MAQTVNASIAEYFPSPEVDIISELGHFFVSSAFTLAANVHSKREERSDSGDLLSVMYYINDGTYCCFADVLKGRCLFPANGEPLEVSIPRAQETSSDCIARRGAGWMQAYTPYPADHCKNRGW